MVVAKDLYQLHITLLYTKPKIWRRILIDPDTTLPDFHKILQTVCGWRNCHMHQFYQNDKTFTTCDIGFEDDENVNPTEYKSTKIKDLLNDEYDKIIYEYDMGDSWEHLIVLEKTVPNTKNLKYPMCTGGKRSFPPEDSGGCMGYEGMLEALNDPEDPEHENYMEWLGGEFDPTYFNKNEINQYLKSPDFGTPSF